MFASSLFCLLVLLNLLCSLTCFPFVLTIDREYDVRCRNPKLSDNEVCTVGDECPSTVCAYEYGSFSTVCCSSGATKNVYTLSSDGWPSNTRRDFCTDRPDGTACGETDEICASAACVGQTCQSGKLAADSVCIIGNDCVGGACGYDAFRVDASLVCCSSGATESVYTRSSDGWPSNAYRDFCTDRPEWSF